MLAGHHSDEYCFPQNSDRQGRYCPLSTLYVLLTAAPPWHLSLCSARCLRQNRGIAWDSLPSVQSEEWQKRECHLVHRLGFCYEKQKEWYLHD